jgi:DNA-binding NarL/FixJ family response regulator
VIFLTEHIEGYLVRTALRLGVRAYVVKSRAVEELVPAIHAVARGEIYVSARACGEGIGSSGLVA